MNFDKAQSITKVGDDDWNIFTENNLFCIKFIVHIALSNCKELITEAEVSRYYNFFDICVLKVPICRHPESRKKIIHFYVIGNSDVYICLSQNDKHCDSYAFEIGKSLSCLCVFFFFAIHLFYSIPRTRNQFESEVLHSSWIEQYFNRSSNAKSIETRGTYRSLYWNF